MSQKPLRSFEFAVLATVLRLADDAYGASVRRELSERMCRDQSVGAVYATLQRLEDKGYLRSWMSSPEPVRGGRARRCYRVTASGRAALERTQAQTDRLLGGAPRRWRPA